jgi:hypothetical protein
MGHEPVRERLGVAALDQVERRAVSMSMSSVP